MCRVHVKIATKYTTLTIGNPAELNSDKKSIKRLL
jgi:hypothetical protein